MCIYESKNLLGDHSIEGELISAFEEEKRKSISTRSRGQTAANVIK